MIAPLSLVALAAPLLVPPSGPVPAGQALPKTWIGADARWVVHVDVQAFVGSAFGRELLHRMQTGEIDAGDLDEVRQELGIDPFQDVHAVTLYGIEGEGDAVVLASTSAGADAVIERLQQSDDYRRVDAEGLTLHVFEDEAFAHVRDTGAGRLFVVSGDAQRVARAVRVVDGGEPNLLQTSTPALTGAPRPGSFLFVEVADLAAIDDLDFDSITMGNAHGLIVEAGESAGRVYVEASVDAGDATQAQELAQVIQGAKALVSLAGGEDVPPAARELIQSIQVQALGTRLSVQLDAPVAALLDLLDQASCDGAPGPGGGSDAQQDERREVHDVRHEIRHEVHVGRRDG